MENQSNKQILRYNLLLGLSGSVACIKLTQLVSLLKDHFNVRIIVTKNAKYFIKQFPSTIQIYEDQMEWEWKQPGDPILHIQLRKWANILIIAPLSCNTLSKIANGQCDNLLTTVARCWNFTKNQKHPQRLKYPFIVCPSMNNIMYEHPVTNEHFQKLIKWGITIIDSIKKNQCVEKLAKEQWHPFKQFQKHQLNIVLNLNDKIKVQFRSRMIIIQVSRSWPCIQVFSQKFSILTFIILKQLFQLMILIFQLFLFFLSCIKQ